MEKDDAKRDSHQAESRDDDSERTTRTLVHSP